MSGNQIVQDGNELTNSHWTVIPEYGKPIVTVDLDHTILKFCGACNSEQMELQEGALEGMKWLSERFYVIIFTGGCKPKVKKFNDKVKWRTPEMIVNLLLSFGIPYDELRIDKPPAMFMLDDRAIHHEGWKGKNSSVLKIRRRMGDVKLELMHKT